MKQSNKTIPMVVQKVQANTSLMLLFLEFLPVKKKRERLNFLFICYIILDIKGFKSVRLTKTIIVSYSVYLHFSLHCLSLVLFLVSGLIIMAVGEVFLSAFLQVLFDRLASRKFIDLLR